MSTGSAEALAALAAPAGLAREALDFLPPRWLRDGHLQSILSSSALRRRAVERRAAELLRGSSDVLLDCGDGVTLLGHHTPRPLATELVVLHHGWEGSGESQYVLSTAAYLWERGYEVFRLNLRDHGASHHLNPEIFHSCRIGEVVGAVREIGRRFAAARRLSLVGFSLGGNFALRVAVRAPAAGIRLAQVVAICPVLEPAHTLLALDGGLALYRLYFLQKWRDSLRKKQAAWPALYDFVDLPKMRDLTTMTERLVLKHSEFADLGSYLSGYALTRGALEGLAVPARILAAEDDPMIPAADLARLAPSPALTVSLTRYGGHCGYLKSLRGPSWADELVHATLAAAAVRR
jgi:predicted alpha/beta-fold hydrolase